MNLILYLTQKMNLTWKLVVGSALVKLFYLIQSIVWTQLYRTTLQLYRLRYKTIQQSQFLKRFALVTRVTILIIIEISFLAQFWRICSCIDENYFILIYSDLLLCLDLLWYRCEGFDYNLLRALIMFRFALVDR